MKKQLILLVFSLFLTANLFSCKDKTKVEPIDTCQLLGFTYWDGNQVKFEYDANGKVVRELTKTDDALDGKVDSEYKYSYDAAGKLLSTTYKIYVSGSLDYNDTDTYTWKDNKIVKATWKDGENNIKYNSNGQMSEFTFESKTDPSTDAKWTYTYDNNDVLVKRTLASIDGKDIYFEFRLNYKSKEIVKTPYIYMPKAGLPHNIYYSRQWEENIPKTDGTYEYYFPDANGKLELALQDTFKEIKLDSKGLVSQLITTNLEGKTQVWNYEVGNCQ